MAERILLVAKRDFELPGPRFSEGQIISVETEEECKRLCASGKCRKINPDSISDAKALAEADEPVAAKILR